MVHIGGVELNLMNENIANIGKTVDVIDLKGKGNVRKTWSVQLNHSTIFMGVAVFGNKIYICGGRNAFG